MQQNTTNHDFRVPFGLDYASTGLDWMLTGGRLVMSHGGTANHGSLFLIDCRHGSVLLGVRREKKLCWPKLLKIISHSLPSEARQSEGGAARRITESIPAFECFMDLFGIENIEIDVAWNHYMKMRSVIGFEKELCS